MKKLLTIALCLGFAFGAAAQNTTQDTKTQIVEASCGQCNFGLEGKGCDLAVRIDGKAYYVDGTKINDHGDAHAPTGFCSAIRKAEVTGQVVKGRFVASTFKLLPLAKPSKK